MSRVTWLECHEYQKKLKVTSLIIRVPKDTGAVSDQEVTLGDGTCQSLWPTKTTCTCCMALRLECTSFRTSSAWWIGPCHATTREHAHFTLGGVCSLADLRYLDRHRLVSHYWHKHMYPKQLLWESFCTPRQGYFADQWHVVMWPCFLLNSQSRHVLSSTQSALIPLYGMALLVSHECVRFWIPGPSSLIPVVTLHTIWLEKKQRKACKNSVDYWYVLKKLMKLNKAAFITDQCFLLDFKLFWHIHYYWFCDQF